MIAVFIKLAWRNLFRNARRSLIAAAAIGLGLAAMIFVDALLVGMKENMVRSATATFLGEAQIQNVDFRTSRLPADTLHAGARVFARVREEAVVAHAAPRVLTRGTITSAAQVRAVEIVGIDPDREKPLSMVDEAMSKGEYLKQDDRRAVLIGRKLAELLEVKVGDRVVLTVSAAESGELSQDLFHVAGIFFFHERALNRAMAFIPVHQAKEMLQIEGIHQIALRFASGNFARRSEAPFWDEYSRHGNVALGWPELLPQLKAALDVSDFSTYVTGIILFGVVALSIVNTLFMALHERQFEFGVLRAVGTRPTGLFQLLALEAASLALVSIVIGALFGSALVLLTGSVGIDYRGIEFAGVTFQSRIHPQLQAGSFVTYPLWVLGLTVLVGCYPAAHAARIQPADAIRRSL